MDEPLPIDTLGRPLRDLRISVTDRCNLRCTYCMPAEIFDQDHVYLPKAEILTFEEITRLARVFTRAGVTKLRITGGEPTLRRDLPDLIRMLAGIDGITDIALTSNGLLLPSLAKPLKDAGLTRITVSLDSLDDATWGRMNGRGVAVAPVIAGVEAALAAGFSPVKINMVVQKGVNDHEVVAMARRWRGTGCIVRFIEYMDVGNSNGWRWEHVLPAREIIARIDREMPLEPVAANYEGEVASRWRYRDGSGEEIGVISSVSAPFCAGCHRARLSARGELFTCLFASTGTDLREVLRSGASDDQLARLIGNAWRVRDDRYSELRATLPPDTGPRVAKVEMSYIGG